MHSARASGAVAGSDRSAPVGPWDRNSRRPAASFFWVGRASFYSSPILLILMRLGERTALVTGEPMRRAGHLPVRMAVVEIVDQSPVMLDGDVIRGDAGLRHFSDDVGGTPLRRDDDRVCRRGEQPVAATDLLAGSRHEGTDFGGIGIDDEGKAYGIDVVAIHEGCRLACPAPDRDRPAGSVEDGELLTNDALGALRRIAVERRFGGGGDLLQRIPDACEAENHLTVIAVTDLLDLRDAARQHSPEGIAGELRVVLVVEIDGATGLDHPVDARHLEIDEATGARAGGSE